MGHLGGSLNHTRYLYISFEFNFTSQTLDLLFDNFATVRESLKSEKGI